MYTHVKKAIREHCINNGAEYYSGPPEVFHKTWVGSRVEVTITLYETHFEKYVREYPAKEGWSNARFCYTHKNAKALNINSH